MDICTGCKEKFRSLAGFAKHRIGSWGEGIYASNDIKRKNPTGYTEHSRRCMTVNEMLEAGMSKNEKGQWITSVYDASIHAEEEVMNEST